MTTTTFPNEIILTNPSNNNTQKYIKVPTTTTQQSLESSEETKLVAAKDDILSIITSSSSYHHLNNSSSLSTSTSTSTSTTTLYLKQITENLFADYFSHVKITFVFTFSKKNTTALKLLLYSKPINSFSSNLNEDNGVILSIHPSSQQITLDSEYLNENYKTPKSYHELITVSSISILETRNKASIHTIDSNSLVENDEVVIITSSNDTTTTLLPPSSLSFINYSSRYRIVKVESPTHFLIDITSASTADIDMMIIGTNNISTTNLEILKVHTISFLFRPNWSSAFLGRTFELEVNPVQAWTVTIVFEDSHTALKTETRNYNLNILQNFNYGFGFRGNVRFILFKANHQYLPLRRLEPLNIHSLALREDDSSLNIRNLLELLQLPTYGQVTLNLFIIEDFIEPTNARIRFNGLNLEERDIPIYKGAILSRERRNGTQIVVDLDKTEHLMLFYKGENLYFNLLWDANSKTWKIENLRLGLKKQFNKNIGQLQNIENYI